MAVTRTTLDRLAIVAGLFGSVVVAIGSIVTAIAYTGARGEPYSPLDHFVSELGEVGVSQLATVFNLALSTGGVCFILFITGLTVTRRGRLRVAYGVTGAIAGIGGALVGVFSMNDLDRHRPAALTFFVFGLVTVLLASIDFLRTRDVRFPGWLAAVGAATSVPFVVFLGVLFGGPGGTAGALEAPAGRPSVSPLTIFEWLLIVGFLAWVFLTSTTWRRATR